MQLEFYKLDVTVIILMLSLTLKNNKKEGGGAPNLGVYYTTWKGIIFDDLTITIFLRGLKIIKIL